jgi:hypothetical protein
MSTWDLIILDKSASMSQDIQKLIIGYNQVVNDQINEGSTNKFTCITFNTFVEIFVEGVFPNINKLNDGDIITSGCTALLDALGEAYNLILKSEHKKVSITIVTDGLENSSKKYTRDDLDNLKKEIDKKCEVNLTFIGSDAECIGLNPINTHISNSINYGGNILIAMRSVSYTMSSQRNDTDMDKTSDTDMDKTSDIVHDTTSKSNIQISINKPLLPPKRSSSFGNELGFKKTKVECNVCTIE